MARWTKVSGRVAALALAMGSTPALGQSGGTITNGSAQGLPPAFLFEPEVPLASLKTVPTWNELEQLLDDPYRFALCSAVPLAAGTPAAWKIRGTPGNDQGFPSYCATVTRRPSFLPGGVPLPPLFVNPLNYNPGSGEEMRLLNPDYVGGEFLVPDGLVQCLEPSTPAGCPSTPDPNRWVWSFKSVTVTPGADRIQRGEAALDHNGPIAPDVDPTNPSSFACVTSLETFPPEGSIMCGGDPGEPGYLGFGVRGSNAAQRRAQYSMPAIPLASGPRTPARNITGLQLFDPERGFITARNAAGVGGLRKPSLRVPPNGNANAPGYLVNTDPSNVTPSNENDYVRNRSVAIALGKAMFWDMQVGSDGIQSCGTCHFNGTGTDTRTRNQLNPNHLGGNNTLELGDAPSPTQPNSRAANYDLKLADFPLHKLANPEIAGDPACTTPIRASVNAGVLENNPGGVTDVTVCDAANTLSDVNDVVSSMGVVFSPFTDIAPIGAFQPAVAGVAAVMPDLRTAGALDPLPVFQGVRRVEPRNTPTMHSAAFNFDNFWDGRARHDFNGGSVFGAADPQRHVFVATSPTATLTPTRQIIRLASIASLATGPGLSEFEMSFLGRNWPKIGKKLLQSGVTPLANQLVSPTDSALGPYSNQPGNPSPSPLCSAAALAARANGKPGLCTSYNALIQAAFFPGLWQSTSNHLEGCFTDVDPALAVLRPNQCATRGVGVAIPVLRDGAVVDSAADPFDGYVLTPAAGPAIAADTDQFTQMEANFSLFWGLAVNLWVGILVPDDTPFDQFLDRNPDAFQALGEPGEPGLVEGQRNCSDPAVQGGTATGRYCFTEWGNFKRDVGVQATINATGENGAGAVQVPAGGTRTPGSNQPDPLLGMDIFFASNLSLKNPNFRTGRCGECHAIPTLTDHTVGFTFKAQMRDFVAEFIPGQPGSEKILEPLGRLRTISGFLLESEMSENGQDGVERRIINQSIVPNPVDGLAYPDGLFNPPTYVGAGQSFFDNGVYNLGVRPIDEDIGRGGNDAFGWPLSLATLMMKNLAGTGFEPGVPMPNFDPSFDPECAPGCATGGLFEESPQDQGINPGTEDEPATPMLPPYLARWANNVNSGEAPPDFDEAVGGLNTLTDVAIIEGFIDTIGPFNPAGVINESLNMGDGPFMGTWPNVNRVGRMGSFKAAQLRNVELTGPYFHNGGKLTLRQVVDFYTRGGDFPVTNAAHRDFNLVHMNIEVQSNLTEAEKVALVDFLLELTDERNRFDQAPFDHPEVIIPVDGLAPDNTLGRGALLASPMFRSVPAVGAAGLATPEPPFLNVTKVRLSGSAANPGSAECDAARGRVSHYCH